MSRWLPALRIARRSVLRSPGRSLLVALLVALPVAGATVVDVVARTLSSPERDAQREIGSADAVVFVTEYSRLRGSGSRAFVRARERRDPHSIDVRALLPAGSRSAPVPVVNELLIHRGQGVARAELAIADAREPLHRHEAELDGGRAAAGDEVLVSRSLAERLDLLDGGGRLHRGAVVRLSAGPTAVVSGLAREQFCLSCERVVARRLRGRERRREASSARDLLLA